MVYLPLKGILQTLFALGRFQPEGESQIEDGSSGEHRCPGCLLQSVLSHRQGAQATTVLPQGQPGPWVGGDKCTSEDCFLANTWKSHVVLVGCSRCLLKHGTAVAPRQGGILKPSAPSGRARAEVGGGQTLPCVSTESKGQ